MISKAQTVYDNAGRVHYPLLGLAGARPLGVTGNAQFEKELTKRLAEIGEGVTEAFVPVIR